ncbi:hypothetical protein [Natrinema gelatinilyticum]|uniref:hypothetical protein n=1 Tax=Natrinema gelatinilyticum TaxID=2961571 RepID=UPI0020C338B9|nr:hypothetical protein [Natrinema gelatinilyticum]
MEEYPCLQQSRFALDLRNTYYDILGLGCSTQLRRSLLDMLFLFFARVDGFPSLGGGMDLGAQIWLWFVGNSRYIAN